MLPGSVPIFAITPSRSALRWARSPQAGQLLLVKTAGRQREAVTELLAQWSLREAFYLIAAGEWLPAHDDLRYAVYRYTTAIDETLERLTLARPFTCYQLLDLLQEAGEQHCPVLVLDFLHLFYDDDIDLAVRQRVLEGCCRALQALSQTNRVAVLAPTLACEAYCQFFPRLAAVAGKILEAGEPLQAEFVQGTLF